MPFFDLLKVQVEELEPEFANTYRNLKSEKRESFYIKTNLLELKKTSGHKRLFLKKRSIGVKRLAINLEIMTVNRIVCILDISLKMFTVQI